MQGAVIARRSRVRTARPGSDSCVRNRNHTINERRLWELELRYLTPARLSIAVDRMIGETLGRDPRASRPTPN